MSRDYEFFTPAEYFSYKHFQRINDHVDNVIHKVKHRLSEVDLHPVKVRTILATDNMRDLMSKVDVTYEFVRKELENRKKEEREARRKDNNLIVKGMIEAINKISSLTEEYKTLTELLYKRQNIKLVNEDVEVDDLKDQKQIQQEPAIEKRPFVAKAHNDNRSLVLIQTQKIEKRLNNLQEEHNQQQKETEVALGFLAENMEKDFTLRANANTKGLEDINEKISSLIMENKLLSDRLNGLTHLVHELSNYGTLNSNVELTHERDLDEQINRSTEVSSNETVSLERAISSRSSRSSLKSVESGISEGTAIVELQLKAGRRPSQAVICQNVNENRMQLDEDPQRCVENLPNTESEVVAKTETNQQSSEINNDVMTRIDLLAIFCSLPAIDPPNGD
uniref:Spindle pole body component SPC42 n=1 Tax=Heterorhabditis bacteriophora TaxID=37862 RepID=A0A1I7X9L7_HETBA